MRRAKVPSTSPTPADKPARTTPPVTVVRGRKGSAILPSLSATAAGRSDSANSGGAAGGVACLRVCGCGCVMGVLTCCDDAAPDGSALGVDLVLTFVDVERVFTPTLVCVDTRTSL